jgi:hypothetical protein
METVTSRAFQVSYQRLNEPVVVKANFRTLGTWYPDGWEPERAEQVTDVVMDALEDEIRHLKRQLAEKNGVVVSKPTSNVRADQGFNGRPFTPVPKPGTKGK